MKCLLCCTMLALLGACSTKSLEETAGPSGPTNVGETPRCDLDSREGILGSLGATGQTSAGMACAADFECWQGQTCVSGKCALNPTDDKTQAELTIDAPGDYLVTVTGPVDRSEDAGQTDDDSSVPLTITTGGGATRESRLFARVPRALAIDAARADAQLLAARVRFEPSLRALERSVPASDRVQSVFTGPARAVCGADTFGFRGACYGVDESFGPLVYSFGGGASLTVKVKKITGKTAILVDAADPQPMQSDIDAIAQAFDTVVLPREQKLFNANAGHVGALDADGNGMIAVVLSSKVGLAGNAGLFDARDVLPVSNPSSNHNLVDMIWAQPPRVSWQAHTPTVETVLGTLAHEYQHIVNFVRGAQKTAQAEALFLNEGLSHLAEDLTGFGATNISAVGAFLQDSNSTGLLIGSSGRDADGVPMRGLSYLYLRYHFEKKGDYTVAADGTLSDGGGIAFLENIMAAKTSGIDSLAAAAGTSFTHFPAFFTALAASGNSAAPLVQNDCRFTFAAPLVDPITKQSVGIKLNDPTRKDSYGTQNLLVGYNEICDKGAFFETTADASAKDCHVFMTGGYTLMWTGAAAGNTLKVQAGTAFIVRLSAVKVK